MRNSIKLAATLALLALLAGPSTQPANAYDFSDILQSLSNGISGWNDLDTRSAEMGNQITAAVAAGQLTAAEANGFKLELGRVMQAEAQIKASGRRLTATDAVSFTNSLNNLATRVQATIDSKTAVNASASLNDVNSLRAQILKQINDAAAAGNLPQVDAAEFRHDLDHNSDIEKAFTTAGGGTVTARQVELLSDDLKKIKTAVDLQVKVAQSAVPQINAQRAAIETKIAVGVSAGTLTALQADDVRRELARIASMQSSFIASDGALTGYEVLALAGQMDRLSALLDSQIALAPVPVAAIPGQSTAAIDARQSQLTKRIDESFSLGRISSQTAADWRRELLQISMIEAAYQRNPAGLNLAQVQNISAQLDDMNARIDRQMLGTQLSTQMPATTGVDLSTRLEQVRKRIIYAVAQGKVTQREADQLYSDLDVIGNNVESAKDDLGVLDDEDQLSFQGDLDRLNYRVEQLLRTRRMGLAQIDARRAQLLKRINEGQNTGQLSRLEASLLKREYNRISRLEAQFKANSGGTLTYTESARLWKDLTQLDQLVTNEVSTRATRNATFR